MKFKKGQSLLELIVAIGIFAISVSSLIFFILDSFISGRLASEITIADFLAEEGMEAVRSIRDNNWDQLTVSSHGLAISETENVWVFTVPPEGTDVSDQLREGTRIIIIEDISSDRKKITSRVSWQFTEIGSQQVELVSYLTNWQIVSSIEIRKPTSHTDFSKKTTNPANAYDYPDGTTFAATRYNFPANPSITFHSWQTTTHSYTSLTLKYRYHADGASDDRYAISYSTSGCEGPFTDLVSPTSAEAPDTTISVNLSPNQDLSQLCLKIYTRLVKKPDKPTPYLYTRDIWTEGTYLP